MPGGGIQPIRVERLDDEVLIPHGEFARKLFNEAFEPNKIYEIKPHAGRSKKSHDHFFAFLNEVFATLPEDLKADFPDEIHFRKKMLIRLGFAKSFDFVAENDFEASRAMIAIRSIIDEYAVIIRDGSVMRVFVAESMQMKLMGRKRFQDAKQAIIVECARMLGVDAKTLVENAKKFNNTE